jgi:hypothetical protein
MKFVKHKSSKSQTQTLGLLNFDKHNFHFHNLFPKTHIIQIVLPSGRNRHSLLWIQTLIFHTGTLQNGTQPNLNKYYLLQSFQEVCPSIVHV